MTLSYVKVWLDWPEKTRALKDSEKGRLIDALAYYARGEDVTNLLTGNERFVFPMFQTDIDRDIGKCVDISNKRAHAGKKAHEANAGKCQQTGATPSKKSNSRQDKDKEEDEEEEKAEEKESTETRARSAPAPARHKYGQYDNVLLSESDMVKLRTEFPGDWAERIETLSAYMASKGVSYKNHLATIRNWARMEKERGQKVQAQTAKRNPAQDYEQRDYDDAMMARIAMGFEDLNRVTGGD